MNPQKLIPLALALLLALWSFPALDQYNITWDEALGDLFFGERYLSYFTSFDAKYLEFQENPYPDTRKPDLFVSYFKGRPWEYYPFTNTLAAAVSTVLARWMGVVDVFDGFHAINIFLAIILIAVMHPFLARRWGLVAATVAMGLLLTAPRIFCHMMANIKDFPLMVFFTLTSLATVAALEKGSVRGLLLAGVLLGMTLGTKANALFFPGIVGLVVLAHETGPTAWTGRRRPLAFGLIGAGLVGLGVMVALWPYLWADPIGRFTEHLKYIGLREGYTREESIAPVFEAVLLTTPPVFLLLAAVGLKPIWERFKKREPLALFVVFWIFIVLARFLLPQAVNFDGVRHFLELFPPMAALAGLGASWLIQMAGSRVERFRSVGGKAILGTALLLPSAWATVSTHPFQIAYWNVFVGGPGGAWESGQPQAGDYWGMSYRQGMRWLNENAEKDAFIAVPVIEHTVRLVGQERLREDLFLLPISTPFSPKIAPDRLQKTRELARERPVYVMFVPRMDWLNELMRDCLLRLEPEAAWELDGAPILYIYRYQPP